VCIYLFLRWDRTRARPALGGGFPFLLFRLQDGFTFPPWLTFPAAPRSPSHNAYVSESVTIHYRWSNLFGATLPVLRRMHREGGDCLVCESPPGNAMAIPIWMTDPSACSAFSVGPPVVSLSALRALRTFLDGLHPTAQCDKPFGNTSPSQSSDAAEKPDQAETGRSVLRPPADASPANRRSRGETPKSHRREALNVALDNAEVSRGGQCDE